MRMTLFKEVGLRMRNTNCTLACSGIARTECIHERFFMSAKTEVRVQYMA